jgi:hypothetical protein
MASVVVSVVVVVVVVVCSCTGEGVNTYEAGREVQFKSIFMLLSNDYRKEPN